MDSFEKVYPSVEELTKVNNNVTCPECPSNFTSEANLNFHLAKTHKKSQLLQQSSDKKVFFCPIDNCIYNKTPHFKQLKPLKQHYLKMHSEKNHLCSLCQKGFPSETYVNRHLEYCNVIFKCCDCDSSYPCYETLKTHSRRKKHNILEKAAYKNGPKNTKSEAAITTNKPRLLLPKPCKSTGIILVSDTSEQSSQTEYLKLTTQNHRETQTCLNKLPRLTVETQTIGDYYMRKATTDLDNLKTAKTQTISADPKTVSCNTSFTLEGFDLGLPDVQRSSSSTQTAVYNASEYIYSSSTSTHDSIYTDTSDLLAESFDTNFFNCHMETQTDFMLNDELFKYCDDYSNMYTQTCEELLLGEIGLNNTHTQTVFDDVLKSVESQTIMSQSKKIAMSCKDMSHMETQTDMQFKQMLEEINA